MFKKTIIILIIILVTFIISIVSFFQYEAESFKNKAQKAYGVFLGDRLKYTPFVVFHFSKENSSDCVYWKAIDLPFEQNGFSEHYAISPSYSTYLMYCYYEKIELEKYIANKLKINN